MAKYTIAFLLYKGFPHGRYNEKHSIAKYNFALRKEKNCRHRLPNAVQKKAFPFEVNNTKCCSIAKRSFA